jgi:hypothetical protein
MIEESVWSRARKDTEEFRNSAKFFWVWEGLGAAVAGGIGGMIGMWVTPENSERFRQYLYPTIGGIVGIVAGLGVMFAVIFIWHLFRAPYRQRDDALEVAMQVQQEYDSVLSGVRYKLAFEGAVSRVKRLRDGIVVQGGVRFRNIGEELIELKIMQFKVILNDKTVKEPKSLTTSGFIHASQPKDYYFEGIKLEGKPEIVSGTLEYEVLYSSVPNTQWYKSARRMVLTVNLAIMPAVTSYEMQEELEE